MNHFMPRFLDDIIPTLASELDFLMHVILSISASFFRMQSIGDQNRHATLALVHMERAIRGQIVATTKTIDRHNFEAVYITSIFIAADAIAQHQFLPKKVDTAQDLGRRTVGWLRVFRGVRALVTASGLTFTQSSLAAVFPRGQWQSPSAPTVINPGSNQPVFGFLLDGLVTQDQHYPAYYHTVTCLSNIYQQPARELFQRFLVEAQPGYVAHVESGEPLALLLMAVCFCLIPLLPSVPMVGRSAERDLEAIILHLPQTHSNTRIEKLGETIRTTPGTKDKSRALADSAGRMP